MVDKKIESLVKLRDAFAFASEALNDLIDNMAPPGIKDDKPTVAEETFTILKFEAQQGSKLGNYEVAYKPNNPAEKWTTAFDVLSKANSTIQSRYCSRNYEFSYWLYGEGKIYRQKRKEAQK